ncbi:DNA glycosylase [Pseudoneurospora amorphoporcata]|uniref:DNA glycosylase n=1 Tax=Pseudoneurospora amorphoporcata TaxID=241081 RepID=A0AAN6NN53_9PEZI|nr:DNA glycosylase [Pseudoneurospora amorphoporcata]
MGIQTRLAAKRLKVDSDEYIVVGSPLENPAIPPSPVVEIIVASIEVESRAGRKRKRGYATPAQPLKSGRDVLPHGLCALPTPKTTPETSNSLSSTFTMPTYLTRSVTKRQSQTPFEVTKTRTEELKKQKTPISTGPLQATTPVDAAVHHTRSVTKRQTTIHVGNVKPRTENANTTEAVEVTAAVAPENAVEATTPNKDRDEERTAQDRRVTRSSSKKPVTETEATQKSTPTKEQKIVKTIKTTKVTATKPPTVDRDSPDYRVPVKRGPDNPMGLTPGFSPYPNRGIPTPEACEKVYRILAAMHGKVEQPKTTPKASLEKAGCGEVPCVLDALLRTLISGNTLMAMADQAIRNLTQEYGLREHGSGAGSINWEKVATEPEEKLAQAIKVSGNGNQKAKNIKLILDIVALAMAQMAREKSVNNGGEREAAFPESLNLDHMHILTKDEAMAKLVRYPGIGIKSAACVTLFCLRKPCFAVDTHVHRFCRWLGWVPEKANPEDCFRHCDVKVPDHLKYGLHQLFIRHGQQCFKCRKQTRPGTKEWREASQCPLEHLLDRGK